MNTKHQRSTRNDAAVADVMLLLEGTYPFVRGGVSSWVHQLICGLPEISFLLVFVGGRRSDYGEMRYELPKNVVGMELCYLEDALRGRAVGRYAYRTGRVVSQAEYLHACLRKGHAGADGAQVFQEIHEALLRVGRPGGMSLRAFLARGKPFEYMRARHLEADPDGPFVSYFWTLRMLHGPIFQLADVARRLPQARVMHSISTGYAGLLATYLKARTGRPLVLTEHGVYTKERRIDLNKAEWIDSVQPQVVGAGDPNRCVRELWVRYFESLGRLTYGAAEPIISLFAGSQQLQIRDGAKPERTRVIVNGIDLQRFAKALAARPAEPPPVIGLIGRVVPIKDIKTFIRTVQIVAQQRPEVQGWLIGGTDEDPSYAKECHAMVKSLGVTENIRFLGHQDVVSMLPQLGALMLTSISEGQPLSVLEAFAAGVPCITTDVGACREQIEGRTDEDRALGVAGRVVPFADAQGLADAALWLLGDPEVHRSCARAALERVRRYYSEQHMVQAYRDVYRRALEA